MINQRNIDNGISSKPNIIITKLSSITLSNDEYNVLCYGLNHGLAKQPTDIDAFIFAEDLWDQLERSKILKDDHRNLESTKKLLCGFAFNILNVDDKHIFKNSKIIKIIKKSRSKIAILKPVKSNGVVLINNHENCLTELFSFSDKKKFSVINNDPTLTRLNTIRKYFGKTWGNHRRY